MTRIADDITCDAPGARIFGTQQYRDFLGRFMIELTGVETVAARKHWSHLPDLLGRSSPT